MSEMALHPVAGQTREGFFVERQEMRRASGISRKQADCFIFQQPD
jgi:hypothetical protein